jgi:hypothetical protein
MAYQVKTTKNYGNRLLDSLKGAGLGFILFGIGTILLFVNEGNYVKNYKTIGDAKKALVKGTTDISELNPALEGKLIYTNGFADTKDALTDELFGASEQAISLARKVEYYQYVERSKTEKKEKVGGSEETTITYTYEKMWVSSPVNSGGFADPAYKGKNVVLANVEKKTQYAKNVSFGAYRLPPFIIASISGGVPVEPRISKDELLAKLGVKADVQVQGNVVYLVSKSLSDPQIGDMRITLTKIVPPAEISIIAKVVGSTFEEFIAPSTERTFSGFAMGTVSAEAMFASAKQANSLITWLLRLIGLILVVMGLKMVFAILPSLFKVLPPLGKIVGAGVTLVCAVGGGAWSLAIIAIAWLFYRPFIGIPMLLVSVAGILFLSKKAKEKKAAAAAASGAPAPAAATPAVTADGWTCACGTVNKGKFCADCGKPKPAGVPQYKCDKCGWEPKDKAHPPKFCPECGDPFDNGDIT